ncbi:S-adenosyl-L-methionine-dependent methyltransferase [Lentithecium fluviatile CBS 122367]|uniref:S-adenosyl-L-methionine-dependent methyltransferase n=1 Tax=Lentithecium fluviatile CBS 122367 TaxID=1168545 RepID=A0A6G1IPB4_9PLEO|nr:S-adenosyl-L-methionine-dependent methyltransferase [Lentithecium fluviatile CBS 122367]
MKNFGCAMKGHAAVVGADTSHIVNGFDWASLGSGPVVDLAGGSGNISIMLAEAFPELRFVVQDLATTREAATAQIQACGLQDRILFEVQDSFEPQAVDHGSIMHDWEDEEYSKILRQLLPAVENGTKIVMCDKILPPKGRKATHMEFFLIFMDLLMFSLLGAKERSIDQWEALVKKTDPRLKVLAVHQPIGSERGLVVVGF